ALYNSEIFGVDHLRNQLFVLRKAPHIWHMFILHCSVFKEHHCRACVTYGVDSFYMLSQSISYVNIFFIV
ncbi:MAG: hypothetical protein PHQ46_07285, partial [Negativicutes bacterium]|nr:hypothetical protein [Negativicutes bacterium]